MGGTSGQTMTLARKSQTRKQHRLKPRGKRQIRQKKEEILNSVEQHGDSKSGTGDSKTEEDWVCVDATEAVPVK